MFGLIKLLVNLEFTAEHSCDIVIQSVPFLIMLLCPIVNYLAGLFIGRGLPILFTDTFISNHLYKQRVGINLLN